MEQVEGPVGRSAPAESVSRSLAGLNFRLLALGQGISRLGDGLYAAALAWTAWRLTQDPSAVALVLVAAGLPAFAGTIVGASYADRFDRRRLMIGSDLARLVLAFALAVLLHLGSLGIGMLAAFAALVGVAGAPFAPARNALVPRIVPPEDLLRANSLLQVSFRATYFVGPLLLGPLVAATSLAGVFAVDAATFAISAGTLAALRLGPAARPTDQLGLWSDLVAGWRVLRRAPDVLIVIGTFVLAVLFASGFLTVGVAALVGTSLRGDAGTYGLLLGIAGTFEVIGALLLLRVRLGNLARTAVLAWALLGLFRFPLGLAGSVYVAGALLAMTGIASALTDIPLIAHVQSRVPDRHLAKALGVWEAGITGAVAIAPPIAAFLIARVGLATGFALSGAALIALGLAAALLLARVDAA